jgi:hypothetical protein
MRAPGSSTPTTQEQLARLVADAAAELMQSIDQFESRLDRLERTIRARIALSERASTLH